MMAKRFVTYRLQMHELTLRGENYVTLYKSKSMAKLRSGKRGKCVEVCKYMKQLGGDRLMPLKYRGSRAGIGATIVACL